MIFTVSYHHVKLSAQIVQIISQLDTVLNRRDYMLPNLWWINDILPMKCTQSGLISKTPPKNYPKVYFSSWFLLWQIWTGVKFLRFLKKESIFLGVWKYFKTLVYQRLCWGSHFDWEIWIRRSFVSEVWHKKNAIHRTNKTDPQQMQQPMAWKVNNCV